MISVSIQLLTLLSGLLINFVIPAVYGLEAYGIFIYTNILVFVMHRMIDIVNEPLIAKIEPEKMFPVSASAALLGWLCFFLVSLITPIGSTTLLASMLLSTCVMLALYSLRWWRFLLVYLLCFILIFSVLLLFVKLHVLFMEIMEILIWTNGLAAIFPASVLAYRADWKGGAALAMRAVKESPQNVSMTFVFNVLTNILPYVLSRVLPYTDLAAFKISASVVQSVGSVFPINSKAIFVMFCRRRGQAGLMAALLSISMLWFSLIWIGALGASMVIPKLLPFLGLISALPILYWAMLSERFVIAGGNRASIMMANIAIGVSILLLASLVDTLNGALMLYAVGIAAYALWVMILVRFRIELPVLSWLFIVAMPVVVYVQISSMIVSFVWGGVIIFFVWWKFRFSVADIRAMRSEL